MAGSFSCIATQNVKNTCIKACILVENVRNTQIPQIIHCFQIFVKSSFPRQDVGILKRGTGMTAIKALDTSSIHRICSGQVILDLSSAIKVRPESFACPIWLTKYINHRN